MSNAAVMLVTGSGDEADHCERLKRKNKDKRQDFAKQRDLSGKTAENNPRSSPPSQLGKSAGVLANLTLYIEIL